LEQRSARCTFADPSGVDTGVRQQEAEGVAQAEKAKRGNRPMTLKQQLRDVFPAGVRLRLEPDRDRVIVYTPEQITEEQIRWVRASEPNLVQVLAFGERCPTRYILRTGDEQVELVVFFDLATVRERMGVEVAVRPSDDQRMWLELLP
jgi:hypothetical protein